MEKCLHGLPAMWCAWCNRAEHDAPGIVRARQKEPARLELAGGSVAMRDAAASGSRRGEWIPRSQWALDNIHRSLRDAKFDVFAALGRASNLARLKPRPALVVEIDHTDRPPKGTWRPTAQVIRHARNKRNEVKRETKW